MLVSTSAMLLASYSLSVSALEQPFVLHEKRATDLTTDFSESASRIKSDTILPIRIGLKQNQYALSNAERWLMEVSDPESSKYGQHWKQDEVIAAFEPSALSVRTVTEWLDSYGIEFTHSDNRQWFAFDLAASRAEDLFQTMYFEHEISSQKTGEILGAVASCNKYYLPANVAKHVDYVVPGVKSGDVTGRTEKGREWLKNLSSRESDKHHYVKDLETQNSGLISHDLDNDDLANCSTMVTPACIRALYQIPLADPDAPVNPNNSMGIFAADHSTYDQAALNAFYDRWTDIPEGTEPIFIPVDGGHYPANYTHGKYFKYSHEEPNGDVQTAQPIVYPQNVTMWDMSRQQNHSDYLNYNYFLRFLDAIDGSFCTYEQQVHSSEGGKLKCGVYTPTNVISYSWEAAENNIAIYWQRRQCLEYLKLGLQGVSMFFSSGDSGIGPWSYTLNKPWCKNGSNNFPRFSPEFPVACPWVTAVGGTKIPQDGTVFEQEHAWRWSGGGFGLDFDRPQYQDAAVEHYFRTSNTTLPYFFNGNYSTGGDYNRNGRGIPDIAAIALNIAICLRTKCGTWTGTSASTPMVAAMFNRINEERLRAGKSTVGFVNPVLYKRQEALNDITVGHNGVCGSNTGFECSVGWDPVTGLGTPNYPQLLKTFMSLP